MPEVFRSRARSLEGVGNGVQALARGSADAHRAFWVSAKGYRECILTQHYGEVTYLKENFRFRAPPAECWWSWCECPWSARCSRWLPLPAAERVLRLLTADIVPASDGSTRRDASGPPVMCSVGTALALWWRRRRR